MGRMVEPGQPRSRPQGSTIGQVGGSLDPPLFLMALHLMIADLSCQAVARRGPSVGPFLFLDPER